MKGGKVKVLLDVKNSENIREGSYELPGGEGSFELLVKSQTSVHLVVSIQQLVARYIEQLSVDNPDILFSLSEADSVTLGGPGPVDVADIDVDVKKLAILGKPIWNSLFKKPVPVMDRSKWAESQDSDEYVYLPNCTRYRGNDAEDFNSNTLYTEVLLEAYKAMCESCGINPVVRTKKGMEIPVLDVETYRSLQTTCIGERASGLVGSTLIDFDDSKYAKKFITCIQDLDPDLVTNQPAKQTVLAKVEHILAGKSSHIFNQRLMQNVFSLMSVLYFEDIQELYKDRSGDVVCRVADILKCMVDSGFVLQKSHIEFQTRLQSGGLSHGAELLLKIFNEAATS
jgi:hypothetical protein